MENTLVEFDFFGGFDFSRESAVVKRVRALEGCRDIVRHMDSDRKEVFKI
jgi:hypothetical protein